MADDLKKTKLIFDLLKQTTSLPVISGFLKTRGLTHSAGSWDDMYEKRIVPAIESFHITNSDLIILLRSVEECGHQHIFLYTCSEEKAIELINRARITSILENLGLSNLLNEADVLDQPPQPQITDVRWETATKDLNIIIKEIELRKFQALIKTETHGAQIHKIYGPVEERVVSVAKLHRDGLMEIRITSHANSSKYETDVKRFWKHIKSFFWLSDFSELSLSVAKKRLWEERNSMGSVVRYSDSTIRDTQGNILRAATGSTTSDLNSNIAVGECLDRFLEEDKNAYCEGANLWFKKNDRLSADIHVLINGECNEFALPAKCSEKDYKYVLSQLRHFNQRVS